jgi:hypothetical protein
MQPRIITGDVIITLTNGKRVANFSSPHPFTFEDGSVLPAVSDEEANALAINFIEKDLGNGDIELEFKIPVTVWDKVHYWRNLWHTGEVDIVFCPLPMIISMKEAGYSVQTSPFRAVRMEDRIKKLVSIHKQCL